MRIFFVVLGISFHYFQILELAIFNLPHSKSLRRNFNILNFLITQERIHKMNELIKTRHKEYEKLPRFNSTFSCLLIHSCMTEYIVKLGNLPQTAQRSCLDY